MTANCFRLDKELYPRAEHFDHFMNEAPCAISLSDDIDVTALRNACHALGHSFYIAFLYTVSYIVNSREEFRMTAVRSGGKYHPAVWDTLDPVHNVFHEDTETYTSLFSIWERDMVVFCENVRRDMENAKRLYVRGIPAMGRNTFEVSSLPWRHFTSVGIDRSVSADTSLAPTIVWGGFREDNGRTYLPLSITIHHAAADGFHLARFLNEAETLSAVIAAKMTGQSSPSSSKG